MLSVKKKLVIFLAVCAMLLPPVSVLAHDGMSHDEEGAAHAEFDLVNTPVSQVEKNTNAAKAKIKKATGAEPGAARAQSTVSGQRTFAAAAADPGVSGLWGPVVNTEVIPVFQAVLPNGKVLIWDSIGDAPVDQYPVHSSTRVIVWDPITNTSKRVDVQGYNIFCAGFAHLPNGNILVAGGNKNPAMDGIVQTHIFNWQTETWTRGANMTVDRWYPSVTNTANGEQIIVGGAKAGADNRSEVYQANGAIRKLTGFGSGGYGGRVYPMIASRPDALMQFIGPYTQTFTVGTGGIGQLLNFQVRDNIARYYGSFAPYDVGKYLVVGGGSITENGIPYSPTRTAVTLDSNTTIAPKVAATGSMSIQRLQHNATALPDGTVLVTGGMSRTMNGSAQVDLANATTGATIWNPVTGTWSDLASAARIRQYHSTASLLPDGRVMTGGGGICGPCVTAGYMEKNVEYFSPPYLFKKDGSGQPADRPVIDTQPGTIQINRNFTFITQQAANIRKVALVGLSDVTHSTDNGQRYVPLKYTVNGTTITATGPGTGGTTPPGYYMLFIVDAAGVPSVAKIVQVAKAPSPLISVIKNVGANRCADVPAANAKSGVYLWSYNCSYDRPQLTTYLETDNTLRVVGNCYDVPARMYNSGQRIWSYGCNGTLNQKWELRPVDGTIRPKGNLALCLTAATAANEAAITINTCNGSNLQKWVW